MKFNYNNICSMDFYGACPDISAKRNDEIMKKCTIGNKKEIHKIGRASCRERVSAEV